MWSRFKLSGALTISLGKLFHTEMTENGKEHRQVLSCPGLAAAAHGAAGQEGVDSGCAELLHGWLEPRGIMAVSWGGPGITLELVQVYQPRYNPAVVQALEKGTRANNGHCTFLHKVESGEVAGCSSHPHKGSMLKDGSHKSLVRTKPAMVI